MSHHHDFNLRKIKAFKIRKTYSRQKKKRKDINRNNGYEV